MFSTLFSVILFSLPNVGGLSLTFDDGPSVNTPIVLDILKKHKVKAAFCIIANLLWKKENLEIAKRIIKEGHTICNHSYSHPDFKKLSPKQVKYQFDKSMWVFKHKLGVVPKYFRPPFGITSKTMWIEMRKHNLKLLMWTGSFDTRDWSPRTTPQKMYGKIIRNWLKGKKGIVLFHDSHSKVVKMLDKLLRRLKNANH